MARSLIGVYRESGQVAAVGRCSPLHDICPLRTGGWCWGTGRLVRPDETDPKPVLSPVDVAVQRVASVDRSAIEDPESRKLRPALQECVQVPAHGYGAVGRVGRSVEAAGEVDGDGVAVGFADAAADWR